MQLDLRVRGRISRDQIDAAEARITALEHFAADPLPAARLTLTPETGAGTRVVADAIVIFRGRVLAAHAIGPTAAAAAEAAADRLRRQLRRVVGARVAQRNEGSSVTAALAAPDAGDRTRPRVRRKPPAERAVVHRRSYAGVPLATLEAVADLLELAAEWHLFTHVRSSEAVVVHLRDDHRIGLLHPPRSVLADEDLVVPEPSRYSSPLAFEVARAELDGREHQFLYFVDLADDRGKVLYVRHDGDYGLVTSP